MRLPLECATDYAGHFMGHNLFSREKAPQSSKVAVTSHVAVAELVLTPQNLT